MRKNILLLAGEPSGDMQAAKLINSIKEVDSEVDFFGLGGDLCENEGMELMAHVRDLALMGFVEVVPAIPRLKALQRRIIDQCKLIKPEAAIFVDYPGFNLSIAPRIKKLGIKTIYYISPQFWAWHESRVKKVKKYIDRMLVILPFEEKFYKKHNQRVDYVGHPFIDIVKPELSKDAFQDKYMIHDEYILLMPGSRKQEVKRHLPLMLEISKSFPEWKWVFLKAPNIDDVFVNEILKNCKNDIKIIDDNNFSVMKYAHFALVGSGSATLECAVTGTPLFVIYKTSKLSYLLAKSMVLVDYIGLVNLVADKMIAPEFIQNDANAGLVAKELRKVLDDPERYNDMRNQIMEVKKLLGDGNASAKAAKLVIEILNLD